MNKIQALVIDDDPAFLMLARLLLGRFGIAGDFFEDSKKAMAHACRQRPDIIFLDMVMPGHSGLEVLQQFIRTPSLADVPIIVTSACSDRETVMDAVRKGAVSYLLTPLQEGAFAKKLAEALVISVDELKDRVRESA
jgi:CheY-like chemotaxis protein